MRPYLLGLGALTSIFLSTARPFTAGNAWADGGKWGRYSEIASFDAGAQACLRKLYGNLKYSLDRASVANLYMPSEDTLLVSEGRLKGGGYGVWILKNGKSYHAQVPYDGNLLSGHGALQIQLDDPTAAANRSPRVTTSFIGASDDPKDPQKNAAPSLGKSGVDVPTAQIIKATPAAASPDVYRRAAEELAPLQASAYREQDQRYRNREITDAPDATRVERSILDDCIGSVRAGSFGSAADARLLKEYRAIEKYERDNASTRATARDVRGLTDSSASGAEKTR